MDRSPKEINLSKIIKHMTVRIPDRPLVPTKPQLSWMGLKPGDLLENTDPLAIFDDKIYNTKMFSSLMTVGHIFSITKVSSEGAEIQLANTNIIFLIESKDWKKSFKRVKKTKKKVK